MRECRRTVLRFLQAAVLVTAACGGARIDSQRVATLPAPLTALTVLSQVGARGELAGAAFEGALLQGAAACGLRASVARQPEPNVPAALTVTWAGGTKDRYGSVWSLQYKATLFETPSQRLLWQANLSLIVDTRSSTDRPAEALARDLLARLRRDHLAPPCTAG
jgi:hypothetical protein